MKTEHVQCSNTKRICNHKQCNKVIKDEGAKKKVKFKLREETNKYESMKGGGMNCCS